MAAVTTLLCRYVVEWVQCADSTHGLAIDWVGVHNESPWDLQYILELRKQLDARGFTRTRIIAPDGDIDELAQQLLQNETARQVR